MFLTDVLCVVGEWCGPPWKVSPERVGHHQGSARLSLQDHRFEVRSLKFIALDLKVST